MKVVVIGTRGFPNVQGGVEAHCQNLYPILVKQGCDVTVLARSAYVGNKPYTYEGVKIVPLSCIRNKHLESFLHTLKGVVLARRYRPDILHIHSIGPGFFSLLGRCLGMKVVLTTHGENYRHLKWGPIARIFLRFCEVIAAFSAHKIIAVSRYIAGELKRKYAQTAIVIPNGVKTIALADTAESLGPYGLLKGKYFIMVGRLVPEKGTHDLIEAYAALKNPDWKLLIVGDSDHDDVYCRKLKVRGRSVPGVVMSGFLSGKVLHEVFSHAGVFVLPSYYEGAPIALLEAMLYGLNCLVSDIAATREMNLDSDCYFLPGDISSLSLKLEEAAKREWNQGDKQRQIGRVERDYNWERIAKQTQVVYQSLVMKRSER